METSGVHSSILSLTMMEEDEHHHNQFSSISKVHNEAPITTSVHDLLECPVCTNSMYPPIHQVCFLNLTVHALSLC
jgi:E3 ubiquitin-protein ligase SIAH1